MNILIINHYAGSIKRGFEYRPYYFGKEFLKRGHNVFIICSSYSHLRKDNPRMNKKISRETFEGLHYYWIRTPRYSGNGVKRALNIISFVFGVYSHIHLFIKEVNPDVIVASSTYPLDIFPASKMAKLNKAKLIFEVHDLWPLTPIELGGMNRNHPFIKLLQIGEDYAYKNSDKIISILPKAKEYMVQHGMNPEKFHFIPNGIDLSEWEKNNDLPVEHINIISDLKNKKMFLVGYAGSIGLANALEFLIDSADILKNKPVSFLIVGRGPEKNKLMEKAKNLKNIYFLPPVIKTSVANFLNLMDVLYIGFLDKPIYRFGVGTNKIYEYMMAGKPIIQSQKAGNDLIEENKCGISVKPEDPAQIAEAVMTLYNMNEEDRKSLGKNGREYVTRNHNFSALAEKFLNAIS